jgi:Flp pilus assembly protein protease CpaA
MMITGTITSLSDINAKKIKNIHLFSIGVVTLFFYSWTFLFFKTSYTTQLLSALIATAIGVLLFFSKSWRPGDAKLFIVYALLMPPCGYEQLLPYPCLPLFINTFLSGLIFLVPSLIISAFVHRDQLLKDIISTNTSYNLLRSFLIIISLSWITSPLLTMLKIHNHVLLSIIMIYIFSSLINRFARSLKRYPLAAAAIFIAGLYLRLCFAPEFFTFKNILVFFINTFAYSLAFLVLNRTITNTKDSQDRVPFAPFLFMGCLLSYTPFLSYVFRILHRH